MSGQERARGDLAETPRVCVDVAAGDALDAEARAWLDAVPATAASDATFRLVWRDGVAELRPPGEHERPGIRATFPADAAPARGGASTKRNPLLKAIGPRVTHVVDVTAGLGGDAWRLAAAGFGVDAFERDAAVFALLASGWRAAGASGAVPDTVSRRARFTRGDGRAAIESLDPETMDVAVYVDPMYPPPKRASAKPRRELQVLRAWLGQESDLGEAAALVERARPRAARVVVKRPHHAEPLVDAPSFEIVSKLVRFDVYANPERMSPLDGAGSGEG